MSHTSCYQCKYLYINGTGYSDWTWMESELTCALGLNSFLPIEYPSDYDDETKTLRTLALLAVECESKKVRKVNEAKLVTVSPDGNVIDGTDDYDQMVSILGAEGYQEWRDGKREKY